MSSSIGRFLPVLPITEESYQYENEGLSFVIEAETQDDLGRIQRSLSFRFCRGSQVRLNNETDKKMTKVGEVPAGPVDHLKAALIGWQPSLNFGWLMPAYRPIQVYINHTKATYMNVSPLPPGPLHKTYRVQGLENLSHLDYLVGRPPTLEEVEERRRQRHEQRLNRDLSPYFCKENISDRP